MFIEPLCVSRYSSPSPFPIVPVNLPLLMFPFTVIGKSVFIEPLCVEASTLAEKFGGADIYSSLRVPSGIGSTVTIEPEGAAIAAAKILALDDKALEKRVKDYQSAKKAALEKANDAMKKQQ